ncbi:MAG: hypothetical protein LBP53_07990 [Candidatus Peribacteria bacterium]|nr:hypothetical protein [Candidatus Peribacteria bacterium]
MNDFIEIANTSGVANLFMLSGAGVRPATGYDKLLDCSKAIVTLDQLLLLKIQGIIGMSSDVKDDTKNLAGNEADSKTQYFSSVSVNNATLINAAKRRAEELCRGKRGSSSNDVICQEGATTKTVSEIAGKTLIVKKGNLILKGVSSLATQPLDIFVDEGVLTFNPESSRISFDTKGHPVSSYAMGVASGVYLKGNFVINGLVKVTQDYKYFIHGKFTSLNTYAAPSSQRMTQLDNLLEPNPTADEIDLTKVFKWRCNYGSGSDGIACPPSEFQGAPLIIINQNYPSRLLQ